MEGAVEVAVDDAVVVEVVGGGIVLGEPAVHEFKGELVLCRGFEELDLGG